MKPRIFIVSRGLSAPRIEPGTLLVEAPRLMPLSVVALEIQLQRENAACPGQGPERNYL